MEPLLVVMVVLVGFLLLCHMVVLMDIQRERERRRRRRQWKAIRPKGGAWR